jgi:DNA replication protein DnaC
MEFKDSLVETYAKRREFLNQFPDLLGLNFIEFATNYEQEKKGIKKRSDPDHIAIQIFQLFSSHPQNPQYHLHCKYQLLRYKAWLDEQTNCLHVDCEDTPTGWVESWLNFLNEDIGKLKVPAWESIIADAQKFLEDAFDVECSQDLLQESSSDGEDHGDQVDWMQVQHKRDRTLPNPIAPGDNIAYWEVDRLKYAADPELAKVDLTDYIRNEAKSFPVINNRPSIDIKTFNRKQSKVYKFVRRHYDKKDTNQLLLRLEGNGGTGKTHVVNAWCNMMKPGEFVVAAPTGRASHNVGGRTLHSVLGLALDKSRNALKGLRLKTLQGLMKNVRYLFIDEWSMVGCRMLSTIDERLRQAMGKPQLLFGGLSIIFVGDPKQLPPVMDTPLWNRLVKDMDVNVKAGLVAFASIKNVVVLTDMVRQAGSDQQLFRELLCRLRMGKSTLSDYETLKTRVYGWGTLSRIEEKFRTALYLMYSNDEVDQYNDDELVKLATNGERTCRIDAYHNSPLAQKVPADLMMGLNASIRIARGARVMLTANVWTEIGLTNGAAGTVRHIIFEKGFGPPNLPIAVVVEMGEWYKGPSLPGLPRHVAINARTTHVQSLQGGYLERTQFPLRLAFAVTIHKCQGILF